MRERMSLLPAGRKQKLPQKTAKHKYFVIRQETSLEREAWLAKHHQKKDWQACRRQLLIIDDSNFDQNKIDSLFQW